MPAPSDPTDFAVEESAVLYAFVSAGTFKLSNKAAVLLSWTNNAPATAQHRVEWSDDSGATWQLGQAAAHATDVGYWGTQFRATVGASIAGVGADSLLLVNLPLATSLDFRIKAQADGDSGYDTIAAHMTGALATVGVPPTAAASFAAGTVTAREIPLTWEVNSTNAAYFEIEAAMDTERSGRVTNSWVVDGVFEAITLDVQARFGGHFSGASGVAGRFVDLRIRAVGGKGAASRLPAITGPWSDMLTLQMAAPAIFITYPTAGTITAEVGAAFSLFILTNTPATTWSVTAGVLTDGLTLTDNEIAGTPTTAESQTVTIEVGDGVTTGTRIFTFNVTASSIEFRSAAEITGRLDTEFTYVIRTRILNGGALAITYSVEGLPDFLTLDGATITGTPVDAGEYSFVVTATTARATNSMVVRLTVAAVEIATEAELSAAVDQEFRLALVSVPAGATFELIEGPDWLAIEDGVLVGTPDTLDEVAEFDLAATLGSSTTTKSITLTVGPLFEVADPIDGAISRHMLEYVKYLGAGTVTEMWLSNQPAGLELWDLGDGGYGAVVDAKLRAIRGQPTQAGLFKPTVTAQVVRAGVFEAYAVDFTMFIRGGLFLPWFHRDAYRFDLQVPLRGDVSARRVRSFYETEATPESTSSTVDGDTTTVTKTPAVAGNLITLKRGDKASLGIIFRDAEDTTVEDITGVKFLVREKDAEDGEYVFEIEGVPATLEDHGYFEVVFEVTATALDEGLGDDSIAAMELLGEIRFLHDDDERSSASFPVTIVEDIKR